jgi:hypothetical protein
LRPGGSAKRHSLAGVVTPYRHDEPSITGPRLKFDRAEDHLRDVEAELTEYLDADPWDIVPEKEGNWTVVRCARFALYPILVGASESESSCTTFARRSTTLCGS